MKAGKDYVGVSTAFILTDGEGKILVCKRSNKCRDEHGSWDTGAGQLEVGLTLEENVKKEVKEEYGCECEILASLPCFGMIREKDGFPNHWVHFPFLVLVEPSEVVNNEPEKIEEMRWVCLHDLPSPLHPGTKKVVEILKLRGASNYGL